MSVLSIDDSRHRVRRRAAAATRSRGILLLTAATTTTMMMMIATTCSSTAAAGAAALLFVSGGGGGCCCRSSSLVVQSSAGCTAAAAATAFSFLDATTTTTATTTARRRRRTATLLSPCFVAAAAPTAPTTTGPRGRRPSRWQPLPGSSSSSSSSRLFLSVRNNGDAAAAAATSSGAETSDDDDDDKPAMVAGVVAPLLQIGPYPCLALRFPGIRNETETATATTATTSQENRTGTGEPVVWTFLLDTGANVNGIRSDLAERHRLERVLSAADLFRSSAAAGVGGLIAPGDVVLLGDCQLAGLPEDQSNVVFLRNLTAASLPHATPVGEGLLGLQFFRTFQGVEFDWRGVPARNEPPTIAFLWTDEILQKARENMTACVPLHPWGPTGEVLLNVTVQGVVLPALLDTGSPVSVLCAEAARKAGIATVQGNQRHLQAGRDYLTVAGMDGQMMRLYRTRDRVSIQAAGKEAGQVAQFGTGYVFVGELPGLARIGQLVGELMGQAGDSDSDSDSDNDNTAPPSSPSMIVGRDVLASSQRMLLQLADGEVWFEDRHREK